MSAQTAVYSLVQYSAQYRYSTRSGKGKGKGKVSKVSFRGTVFPSAGHSTHYLQYPLRFPTPIESPLIHRNGILDSWWLRGPEGPTDADRKMDCRRMYPAKQKIESNTPFILAGQTLQRGCETCETLPLRVDGYQRLSLCAWRADCGTCCRR